jgi:hypothetical protein
MTMAQGDDLKPWDRQPGESSKAYAAFTTYRDQGQDRTVRTVAEVLGKSNTLIVGWSSKYNWVSRAAAWDSIPGRAVAEAYEEMAADIARQHRALSDKLMARLSRNLDLLPEGADPTIKWSTAHTAAHRGHSFATDLSKPKDMVREEISKKISDLIEKLAGGDE